MHSYILLHTSKHGTTTYPFQTTTVIKMLTPRVQEVLVRFFKINYNEKQMDEALLLQKVTRLPTIIF